MSQAQPVTRRETEGAARTSPIDIILLGLLMEGPRNAYEINKVIEQRRIRTWVKISEASVYRNLRALADKGALQRRTTRDGLNPEKTVFSLTSAGREAFTRSILDAATHDVTLHFDFDVWLAHLGYLTDEQAEACASALRGSLEAAHAEVGTMLESHRDELPRDVAGLMELRIRVLEVIESWLDESHAGAAASVGPPPGAHDG